MKVKFHVALMTVESDRVVKTLVVPAAASEMS